MIDYVSEYLKYAHPLFKDDNRETLEEYAMYENFDENALLYTSNIDIFSPNFESELKNWRVLVKETIFITARIEDNISLIHSEKEFNKIVDFIFFHNQKYFKDNRNNFEIDYLNLLVNEFRRRHEMRGLPSYNYNSMKYDNSNDEWSKLLKKNNIKEYKIFCVLYLIVLNYFFSKYIKEIKEIKENRVYFSILNLLLQLESLVVQSSLTDDVIKYAKESVEQKHKEYRSRGGAKSQEIYKPNKEQAREIYNRDRTISFTALMNLFIDEINIPESTARKWASNYRKGRWK